VLHHSHTRFQRPRRIKWPDLLVQDRSTLRETKPYSAVLVLARLTVLARKWMLSRSESDTSLVACLDQRSLQIAESSGVQKSSEHRLYFTANVRATHLTSTSMTIPDLEASDLILSPTRSPRIAAPVNDLPGRSGLRCPSAGNPRTHHPSSTPFAQGPEKSMTIFHVRSRCRCRGVQRSICACKYVYVPVDPVDSPVGSPCIPRPLHFRRNPGEINAHHAGPHARHGLWANRTRSIWTPLL
jgi:hypothetical protein